MIVSLEEDSVVQNWEELADTGLDVISIRSFQGSQSYHSTQS